MNNWFQGQMDYIFFLPWGWWEAWGPGGHPMPKGGRPSPGLPRAHHYRAV